MSGILLMLLLAGLIPVDMAGSLQGSGQVRELSPPLFLSSVLVSLDPLCCTTTRVDVQWANQRCLCAQRVATTEQGI
jgi:hypothetical protein